MKNKRYYSLFILVILGLFHFVYGIIPAWNKINSDFPNYYTSSKLLLEGANLSQIYTDSWFQGQINKLGINERGKFSPFPPPTVFVMVPLAIFSPLTAKRVFLIINIILIISTAYLFKKITLFSYTTCLNIILLSGAAIVNNFLFGQLYVLLLFISVSGYYYLINEKEYASGILWGAGAAIKYFPLIFIPVLIIKRKWKALGIFILTTIVINVAAFLAAGEQVYNQFFNTVLFTHLNGHLSSQSDFAFQFQSWNSLLRNLFVFNPIENIHPVINSPLIFDTARVVIYLLFTGLTSFAIYKTRNSKHFISYSIALPVLLLLVLSPASATYHLVLLSFPFILTLSANKQSRDEIYGVTLLIIYVIIGFSPFVMNKLAFSKLNVLISYYHLWFLTLFYIVTIMFVLNTSKKENLP